VRWFRTVRAILPLLALAVFWWAQPEAFAPFLDSGFVLNLGSADQPHELFVSTAAIVLVPIALCFGLPLILKAALLLPYVAAALSHGVGRRATFDPARDLPSDSFTPGSQEEASVDKAITAALAARNAAPQELRAFAKVDPAFGAVAPAPARLFGRHDAAA
jgi:hypothetical protein